MPVRSHPEGLSGTSLLSARMALAALVVTAGACSKSEPGFLAHCGDGCAPGLTCFQHHLLLPQRWQVPGCSVAAALLLRQIIVFRRSGVEHLRSCRRRAVSAQIIPESTARERRLTPSSATQPCAAVVITACPEPRSVATRETSSRRLSSSQEGATASPNRADALSGERREGVRGSLAP